MKIKLYLSIMTAALILLSCSSSPENGKKTDAKKKISGSCYEVVTPYLIPQNIEFKKKKDYESKVSKRFAVKGTAFAISSSEFITAFNTFSLFDKPVKDRPYYIRNSRGEVYEIREIKSFSSTGNYTVFTVKDFKSPDFFEVRSEPYKIHEKVYHAGTSGESGIVLSSGTILDDTTVSKTDERKIIKSSLFRDIEPAGGPLLDKNLKLIGMVIKKDDRYTLSMPVETFIPYNDMTGIIKTGIRYSFSPITGEQSDPVDFEYKIELPKTIKDLKENLSQVYMDSYKTNMEQFFQKTGGLFPEGEGSYSALYDSNTSPYLQMLYKTAEDNLWRISNLEKHRIDLKKSGYINYSKISGNMYMDLIKPNEITFEELYSSPKMIMDTILSAVNMTANLDGNKRSVKSYGIPYKHESFEDRYTRLWNIDYWYTGIGSKEIVTLLMWTPTPSGLTGILRSVEGTELTKWIFDLKKTADLLLVPYSAKLKNWKGYLSHPVSEKGPYKDLEIAYENDKWINVEGSEVSFNFENSIIQIDDNSQLSLSRDIYPSGDKYVWGLRKIAYNDKSGKNLFISYRFIKPEKDIDKKISEGWERIANEEPPYNSVVYHDSDSTIIGGIHSKSRDGNEIQALYLDMFGSYKDGEMEKKINFLKQNLETVIKKN